MRVTYAYPTASHDYETEVLVRNCVGSRPDSKSTIREGRLRKRVLEWHLFGAEAQEAARKLEHLAHPSPTRNIEVEI